MNTTVPDSQPILNLRSVEDLAEWLGVPVGMVNRARGCQAYSELCIRKRRGGTRMIHAPSPPLKFVQRRLADSLARVYEPPPCVQGFVSERDILTNARPHVRKRYVLNLDLKDFFPSIHYGRVRGMLHKSYGASFEVADAIAQIACFQRTLPQGSPCSPIIANMLCRRMDIRLMRLAKVHGCTYTRYADDMTFSSRQTFSSEIVRLHPDGSVGVGHALEGVIRENGFEIQEAKTRLMTGSRPRLVTGLVVNEKVNVPRRYVRRIRAMLHAWHAHGYEAAEAEFRAEFDRKHRRGDAGPPSFRAVVAGMIEHLRHVRGHGDQIVVKYDAFLKGLEEAGDMYVFSPGANRSTADDDVSHALGRTASEESLVLDYKIELNGKVIETICAYLNTEGGRIELGVDDAGTKVGLAGCGDSLGRDAFLQRIWNMINDGLDPIVTHSDVNVAFVPAGAPGRVCAIVEVQASTIYHYYKDNFYVRVGNTTRKLSPKEAIQWQSKKPRQ